MYLLIGGGGSWAIVRQTKGALALFLNNFHLLIKSHPVNLSISFTGGKEIK